MGFHSGSAKAASLQRVAACVFFYGLFQWGLEQTMGYGGMLKRSQAFIARESLHSFALAFHTRVLDGFSTKTSVFGWKLLLSALVKSKSLRVSEANGCQTETLSGSQWFQSCIMMSFYPPPKKVWQSDVASGTIHQGLEPMSGGDQLQDEVWLVGVRGWWDGWREHKGNMRELGFLELC